MQVLIIMVGIVKVMQSIGIRDVMLGHKSRSQGQICFQFESHAGQKKRRNYVEGTLLYQWYKEGQNSFKLKLNNSTNNASGLLFKFSYHFDGTN